MTSFDSQWIPGPRGATSDCYYCKTDDRIFLKLFHARFPKELAEREYATVREIHAAGKLTVPYAQKLLAVNGRRGIVYERIFGKTYAEMLKEHTISPSDCAEHFGKEAFRLHHTEFDTDLMRVPQLRDEIEASIDFLYSGSRARQLFHRTLDRIYAASKGDILLHGDLHPGNLMFTEKGRYWIDMGYAAKGPAIFDLAAADVMLNFLPTALFIENQFGLPLKKRRQLYTHFLETYFQTDDRKEIKRRKKKIRLCSIFSLFNIAYRFNWQGKAKHFLKPIMLITVFVMKRHI